MKSALTFKLVFGVAGLEHIAKLFRHEKRLVARFVATALGRAAATMAVLFLIKQFLSGGIGAGDSPFSAWIGGFVGTAATMWVVAGLVLLAYVASALMQYDNQVAQQRIIKVLELGMMRKLIRHLLSLSVPFFDRQSHGDIVQAVRMDITQLRMVIVGLANLFLEGAQTVALLATALYLSPWLTLWGLIVMPLTLWPILRIAKSTLQRSYSVRKSGYVLFDLVLQLLNGIRVIKAYKLEDQQAETSVQKGRAYFDQMIEMVRIKSMSQVVLESMAGLGIVVVIVLGGIQITKGELSWAALMAFVMAMRQLQGPLNNMHMHFVHIQTNGASVQRILDLLATKAEVVDRKDAIALPEAPRTIQFEGVNFSYKDKTVLSDVSFEIPAGSTIGIVGPSGSGKSTLLNLIVRFYDPSSGRVMFDGRDLRDFKIRDVYDKIAIVMQEPFLFGASVRDNIRCARPEATDAEVESAARAAYIHEEIINLPQGYDTVVGSGGQGLSGGQRQRLNVARALLKDAPILLLDEATSALDSVAEAEVQRAIDKLMQGRTSFVIAHRLSTLRNADKILVLDKGKVVGFGTHEELRVSCATYKKLCDTQKVGERPSPAKAA